MSDDPLDPDDWRDGNDDEAPDDTPDDTDPFADVTADRTGDPFEELGVPPGGPSEGSADEDREGRSRGTQPEDDQPGDDQPGDGGTTDAAGAWQPLSEASDASEAGEADEGRVSTVGGAGAADESAGLETGDGTEDPFAGPDPRGDPFEEEELFERQEVGAVDPDEVWEDLADSDQVESDDGSHYAEVSKHTYCENCEWFSEPPAVSCTHEGTEIVEFLDTETVRLLNCPIVEERRAIRDED